VDSYPFSSWNISPLSLCHFLVFFSAYTSFRLSFLPQLPHFASFPSQRISFPCHFLSVLQLHNFGHLPEFPTLSPRKSGEVFSGVHSPSLGPPSATPHIEGPKKGSPLMLKTKALTHPCSVGEKLPKVFFCVSFIFLEPILSLGTWPLSFCFFSVNSLGPRCYIPKPCKLSKAIVSFPTRLPFRASFSRSLYPKRVFAQESQTKPLDFFFL